MRTISAAVQEIFSQSDIAQEAYREGYLNLNAYAKTIHTQVEELTMKSVKLGTIVVALSRLPRVVGVSLRPKVKIDDLTIQGPLVDITYERTQANSEKISSLLSNVSKKNLVISEGIDEITIIAAQELQDDIKAHFSALPKNVFTDLVGICVRFPSEYIEVPNALFSLISGVSLQRINIIELVSTYTQLMIVVRQEDRERTVGALQKFF